MLSLDDPAPPETWATAFSAWVEERLQTMDASLLGRYASEAPHAAHCFWLVIVDAPMSAFR